MSVAGTAALCGGLGLNCICGMTMMHPVEWHRRDPKEVRKERARLVEESRKRQSEGLQEKLVDGKIVHPVLANRRSTIHVAQVLAKPSRWSSLGNLKEGGGTREVPLLIETHWVRTRHRPRKNHLNIEFAHLFWTSLFFIHELAINFFIEIRRGSLRIRTSRLKCAYARGLELIRLPSLRGCRLCRVSQLRASLISLRPRQLSLKYDIGRISMLEKLKRIKKLQSSKRSERRKSQEYLRT